MICLKARGQLMARLRLDPRCGSPELALSRGVWKRSAPGLGQEPGSDLDAASSSVDQTWPF